MHRQLLLLWRQPELTSSYPRRQHRDEFSQRVEGSERVLAIIGRDIRVDRVESASNTRSRRC